jgi:outer membrane protein, heavy metal efflux system
MRTYALMVVCVAGWCDASALGAQRVVTRAAAIAGALEHGPRVQLAAADTLSARALILGARAFANPVLAASYSKSVPQYHVAAELPLDFPWLRRLRLGSATAFRDAAHDRFAFERASVTFDAETTYTNALVARAHADLSRRNAQDADSLLRISRARRDAGDASELDVQQATVFLGQQVNQALSDSMAVVSALLELQALMGDPADAPTIALGDTLGLNGERQVAGGGTPLSVSAASAVLQATEMALSAEHRTVWGSAAIQFGFEYRDPTGVETGILPTVGIAIPLPLLNRNEAGIAAAEAERNRARADLELIRLESTRDIARISRTRDLFVARVTRDRALLRNADSVATMSLTAYREGAVPLASVFEAQRIARETLAQYIDDLGAANDAIAALRMLTASASHIP